jgi:hypothetical protein
VRDKSDREARGVDGGDGQARAVDRDRALLDDVAEDVGRGVDPHAPPITLGLAAADAADAVDVPLDEVAAQGLTRAEGSLEVDAVAALESRERGALERLGHELERDPAVRDLDRRQAAAVHRDRVADREPDGRRGRLDLEPHPAVSVARNRCNAPDLPHESCEHSQKATREAVQRNTPTRSASPPTRGKPPTPTVAVRTSRMCDSSAPRV